MNLSYNIKELTEEKNTDIEDLINEINERWKLLDNLHSSPIDDKKDISSRLIALELNYDTNYTVKMLKMIMDYYQISKRKMIKSEMIQSIILFEEDDNNNDIVEKRRKLWGYMKELKEDSFFSKYIIINN